MHQQDRNRPYTQFLIRETVSDRFPFKCSTQVRPFNPWSESRRQDNYLLVPERDVPGPRLYQTTPHPYIWF